MRLRRAGGSANLRKVASHSAVQGYWRGDRKVRSQVVGENRRQVPTPDAGDAYFESQCR